VFIDSSSASSTNHRLAGGSAGSQDERAGNPGKRREDEARGDCEQAAVGAIMRTLILNRDTRTRMQKSYDGPGFRPVSSV
jgi:hypothetical protein